jgi:uncharacterized membrane protein
MKLSAENYVPQADVVKLRNYSRLVWGIFTFIVFIWLFFIVSAPIFEANGIKSFSQPTYRFFSYICHQINNRSLHYHEFPFAVCSRCFGVYLGFFIGLIVYPLFRKIEETEPFPRIWLFLAMIPMGIDFSLGFFNIWENTHLSRVITGGILGFACAVFIVPALADIVKQVKGKFQVKGKR